MIKENAAQLRQRMALAGAKLLVKILDKNPSGKFSLSAQDETHVTHAPKVDQGNGQDRLEKTRHDRSLIKCVGFSPGLERTLFIMVKCSRSPRPKYQWKIGLQFYTRAGDQGR